MLHIELTFEDGQCRRAELAPPVLIGRAGSCALRIANWRVGRQHARLSVRGGAGISLEDLGALTGTIVNGNRVARYHPVLPDDEILIGPCRIKVRQIDLAAQDTGDGEQTEIPVDGMAAGPASPEVSAAVLLLPHRRRLHAALLEALDLRRRAVTEMSDILLRSEAERLLMDIVAQDENLPPEVDRAALGRAVLDEAVGLGPLESLLDDAGISEIMVNRYDEIYVERGGRLWPYPAVFSSEQSVRWVIERIVAPLGRRIDESAPMVDARLPDGSRVNAVIPPVAIKGANITIRKFPRQRPDMPALLRAAALDDAMAVFLFMCVQARKNIVVSGGTGSGKTTLLNILSNAIPEGERVVTIEDAAELRLNHAHLVALEARPANLEGRGRIDIRDLVRNALRMRPDRIVVGECRGAEALDMLTAMNTGHEGSLTTLHANSARDALARLEAMILMSGLDLPLAVVREHIAASVDIIVQQARQADGRRVITSIVELSGMESGRIQLQELFRFDRASGGFAGCGMLPSFSEAWRLAGMPLDPELFCGQPGPAGAPSNTDGFEHRAAVHGVGS